MQTFIRRCDRKSVFLSTRDKDLANKLKKDIGKPTIHYLNGREIEWQFIIPKRIIPLLKTTWIDEGE